MRTLERLQEQLAIHKGIYYDYVEDEGLVAWSFGTGGNLELLYIEAHPGFGRKMLLRMADKVVRIGIMPYHSVYAFVLASNGRAHRFYEEVGFTRIDLGASVYRDDGTFLFWILWHDLVNNLREERR